MKTCHMLTIISHGLYTFEDHFKEFFSESSVLCSSFTPLCYTGAGDLRNHPVIYGNMYFWQLRYHAKIATPLWDIHKRRSKKYIDRVRLDNFFLIFIKSKKNPLLHDILKPRKNEHLPSQ